MCPTIRAKPSPAPGIRWDAVRGEWIAAVEVGTGKARPAGRKRLTSLTRFPAGTQLRTMTAWQESARVQLRAQRDAGVLTHAAAEDGPTTLQQAADRYLPTITGLASYPSRTHDLAAWTKVLGHRQLATLRPVDFLLVWNGWRSTVAVSTLQHRRTALLQCLTLQAPALAAVVRTTIPRPTDALGVPRELPYPTIVALLDAMPTSRAQAFLRVMAETGLPPATIRRLTRRDVDRVRRTVRLPPRQKGAGVAGVVLPLTAAACEAFAAFDQAQAWTGVSRVTLGLVWQRACAAVRAGAYRPTVPRSARGTLGPPLDVPACSPYVLRHSFAGRVLDATGGDLQVLQQLLQHFDISTSLRYARARAGRAVTAAIHALDTAKRA